MQRLVIVYAPALSEVRSTLGRQVSTGGALDTGDAAEAAEDRPAGAVARCFGTRQTTRATPRPTPHLRASPNGGRTIAGVVEAAALLRLGPADLAGIRHVRIDDRDAVDDAVARSLARLDPESSCVELWNISEVPKRVAGLDGVRCLRLVNSTLSAVARLRNLRYFWTDEPAMDAQIIARNQHLVLLHVTWGDRIENLGALSRLRELRVLEMRGGAAIEDLRFAQSLRELREIDVSGCRVESLAPLQHLPRLRQIRANFTHLTRLPRGRMPSLEVLEVMSAGKAPVCDDCDPGPRLSDVEVERFQHENPQTVIAHRYNQVLGRVMARVTRVRVRTGGTCHRSDLERTLLVLDRLQDIRAVVRLMAVEEPSQYTACMCCGDPTFELYRDEVLLASVGVHHGTSLRGSDGWPSDAPLVDGDRLSRWLAQRGVPGPLEERRRSQAR